MGCVALGVLGAVSACLDPDSPPIANPSVTAFAGAANVAGSALGGGGGSGSAAGGSVTSGTGGSLALGGRGGSLAEGESPTAGAGGDAPEAGTGAGGAAPEAGAGGQGAAPEGGAGGVQSPGGAGGEGGVPDAPLDPKCDFSEVESNFNIATGLGVSGAVKTLCGQSDPGHFDAAEGLLDRDGFDVSLAAEADVLVRLEMPNRAPLSRVEVWLNGGKWLVRGDQTVFRVHLYDPGVYMLALRAYSAADITEAVPYTLSIGTDDVSARCAKPVSATYVEGADGASSTGNDVFQFSNSYVASLTPGDDAPEATAVTLGAPGSRYRFDGNSAAVTGAGGPFYDGDSYAFRSGSTAQQVTVRADWTTQSDLDLFLFQAGAVPDQTWGISRRLQPVEYFTFMLEPNTDYQVYAAAYGGVRPFDYSVTVCSEQFDIRGK